MISGICQHWPGRIVVVVCAPVLPDLRLVQQDPALNGTPAKQFMAQIGVYFRTLEMDGACSIDFELALYSVQSVKDPRVGLYPVNAVRNRALNLASTPTIFLMDVDFVPSLYLTKLVKDQGPALEYLVEMVAQKRAIVIPAFGHSNYVPLPNGTDLRAARVEYWLADKRRVVEAYIKESLPVFYEAENPLDHGATNFSRWITSTEWYPITYEKLFEPYVIIAKEFVPWYDERFVGYYRNKVSHLDHMYSIGIDYFVHPHAYVLHRPHPPSVAFRMSGASTRSHFERMLRLYGMLERDMSRGVFVPVTSFGASCHTTSVQFEQSRVAFRPPRQKWERENQITPKIYHSCIEAENFQGMSSIMFPVDLDSVREIALKQQVFVHPKVILLPSKTTRVDLFRVVMRRLEPALCVSARLDVLELDHSVQGNTVGQLGSRFLRLRPDTGDMRKGLFLLHLDSSMIDKYTPALQRHSAALVLYEGVQNISTVVQLYSFGYVCAYYNIKGTNLAAVDVNDAWVPFSILDGQISNLASIALCF